MTACSHSLRSASLFSLMAAGCLLAACCSSPNSQVKTTIPESPAKAHRPLQTQANDKPQEPESQLGGMPQGMQEVFPHVRMNVARNMIEFDAVVPIDAHDPQKPRTYLEVIACPPDTKEHEALLMAQAKPSHVHAALLLLNIEPGKPGVWDWSGESLTATPPTGPQVFVTVLFMQDGKQHEADVRDWVIDADTKKTLRDSADQFFVFAGSQQYTRQGQVHYRADVDGTLIGLTTFGGETIAWTGMYSPDSGVEEPRWIANALTVPTVNTPCVVRIRKARPKIVSF